MKTILVVEDFLQARNQICEKLQKKGYHTLGAASVQEAYNVLSLDTDGINLVLSDADMPDTTGFDLLRKVKKSPKLKSIPFVFLNTETRRGKNTQASRNRTFFKEINRAINTEGCIINLITA